MRPALLAGRCPSRPIAQKPGRFQATDDHWAFTFATGLTGPRSTVHPGESDVTVLTAQVDAPGGGGEPGGPLRPALRPAVLPRRRPAAAVRRPARRRTALTATGGSSRARELRAPAGRRDSLADVVRLERFEAVPR